IGHTIHGGQPYERAWEAQPKVHLSSRTGERRVRWQNGRRTEAPWPLSRQCLATPAPPHGQIPQTVRLSARTNSRCQREIVAHGTKTPQIHRATRRVLSADDRILQTCPPPFLPSEESHKGDRRSDRGPNLGYWPGLGSILFLPARFYQPVPVHIDRRPLQACACQISTSALPTMSTHRNSVRPVRHCSTGRTATHNFGRIGRIHPRLIRLVWYPLPRQDPSGWY